MTTIPVADTTATLKDDHAGLPLDPGVNGPRRSHIGARIAACQDVCCVPLVARSSNLAAAS